MSNSSAVQFRTASLGYPAIGGARELKWALEAYWRSEITADALQARAATIRATAWQTQVTAGIDDIPCGEFSYYDRMLDLAFALGAIPDRFAHLDPTSLATYFALARGMDGAAALDMTKWFDTNYHYVQPEISRATQFQARVNPYLAAYLEAQDAGILTRPVLIGPLTFLALSAHPQEDETAILARLVPAYCALLAELARNGVRRIQIDEPIYATDVAPNIHAALSATYTAIRAALPAVHITFATYFGGYGPALDDVLALPISAVHLDCTRAAHEIPQLAARLPAEMELSLGCIDGRNIWRTDNSRIDGWIAAAVQKIPPGRITLATSCSLTHVPVDLTNEKNLAPEVYARLAFANQKLAELHQLAQRATPTAITAAFADVRSTTAGPHANAGQPRELAATESDYRRGPLPQRVERQNAALQLPILPTTTIGSLPQTPEVRRMRSRFRRREITADAYDTFVREAITEAIALQERIGIDVLVHGEFERTDMVEFFGEKLAGFATSENGWVVSYGSRCVKPPILFGDVASAGPMTTTIAAFAQSCTRKPVKGMLTGPLTMLQWSFVREDQPRSQTAFNVAAALAAEVRALHEVGIRIIQIDEPGLREGLPLRVNDRTAYLQWATRAFRAASSGIADEVQIHTHMCYADFTDILPAIAELDADVVTFEASRSNLQLLPHLRAAAPAYNYGPGVFDIHSPVIPSEAEIADRIRAMQTVLGSSALWINPDCGLKTRTWEAVTASLTNLCRAAATVRSELTQTAGVH